MELKDVVSVTGMPGLHKIIGRNKNGLILESLSDKKKFSTTPRQRISILSDIAMFTDEGEVRLAQVLVNLKNLEETGESVPTSKADNSEVTAFMAKVLPTYDRERVYVSDMKKLFTWYYIWSHRIKFLGNLKDPIFSNGISRVQSFQFGREFL